eukprot:765936-Hanusia_phi.AAC.3
MRRRSRREKKEEEQEQRKEETLSVTAMDAKSETAICLSCQGNSNLNKRQNIIQTSLKTPIGRKRHKVLTAILTRPPPHSSLLPPLPLSSSPLLSSSLPLRGNSSPCPSLPPVPAPHE